ncbi:hypothetical protein I862_03510 [endosymbiont of Acanthamoeba sp. UWC8]|uniref:hypothetical protein n=1 Tax=endosymbiont of Acanthamoeba sp. UWC8 TaxID=86106 RepID=UPI0004D13D6E|nr:hypothetical protein [endosymbiont of Acanthamoeba sp. UWC8]AIF81262.1 hypothetical protein I862_03510 [endosymbiont of Acanthamoeba sp. UWC8]
MAVNQNKKSNSQNLTNEDKQRMSANYAAMGKKGGDTTKETYGSEFYKNIGKEGGNARKEQMAHSSSYTNKEKGNK